MENSRPGTYFSNGGNPTLKLQVKKDGRLLYCKSAYLICSDNEHDIETLLEAYLWRWEIEVNFRE
mgnify:CR=1 FL=1|tara:strand:- start:5165 stop:5359 length:195 start_codon:yes stop_codon:yes gene_type:complete